MTGRVRAPGAADSIAYAAWPWVRDRGAGRIAAWGIQVLHLSLSSARPQEAHSDATALRAWLLTLLEMFAHCPLLSAPFMIGTSTAMNSASESWGQRHVGQSTRVPLAHLPLLADAG